MVIANTLEPSRVPNNASTLIACTPPRRGNSHNGPVAGSRTVGPTDLCPNSGSRSRGIAFAGLRLLAERIGLRKVRLATPDAGVAWLDLPQAQHDAAAGMAVADVGKRGSELLDRHDG